MPFGSWLNLWVSLYCDRPAGAGAADEEEFHDGDVRPAGRRRTGGKGRVWSLTRTVMNRMEGKGKHG